jgi:NADPH-dependent 2,4-dienoyl-CoA reductase/sulfur reductase-like enzyme
METAASRSIVLAQIEMRLDEDFHTPGDGTRIKAIAESADGVGLTEDLAVAETLRALNVLVRDGVIEGVNARAIRDQYGRLVVEASWRDRATGTPVDNVRFRVQGAG